MELSAEAFDAQLTADAPPVVTEPVADLTSFDDEADVNDAKATDDAKAPVRDDKGKFAKAEEKVEEKPADKKPRNDPQARIDQAIARQREAERKAEAAEARNRELEALAKPAPKAEPAKVATDKFPSFAQYAETHADATLEDYMDARDDHRDQVKARKDREAAEETARKESHEKRAKRFGDLYKQSAAELRDSIDAEGLLSVTAWNDHTPSEQRYLQEWKKKDPVAAIAYAQRSFMVEQFIDSEYALEIAAYLSKPGNFQRIATLPSEAHVIREIAKLEAGFSAASDKESSGPAPEATPPSKAHAPIKPLGSAPRVPEDEGSDDEPVEKHIARENAKDRKAGRL